MMYKSILLIVTLMSLFHHAANAQVKYPLYKGEIPNSIPNTVKEKTIDRKSGREFLSNTTVPCLIAYLPEKKNNSGTSVIICPGGGYSGMAITHEGSDVAKEFQKLGIAAFVLHYRTPLDSTMVDKSIGPLQDAQQAIKMVREHATEWNLDVNRVGIAGFSAGGHLASSLGTHFTTSLIDNKEHTTLRPDFMILLYPVISFADDLTHMGSRNNLLGKTPSKEQIENYSNELQVGKNTPITFLVHAGDDNAVSVNNSLVFYKALQHNNVPAELIVYPKGGHGFGLINPTTPDRWFEHCINWLISNSLLPK